MHTRRLLFLALAAGCRGWLAADPLAADPSASEPATTDPQPSTSDTGTGDTPTFADTGATTQDCVSFVPSVAWWEGWCCAGELELTPNGDLLHTWRDPLDSTVISESSGQLTDQGIAALCAEAAALEGVQLEEVYGYPHDGEAGGASITLDRLGSRTTHDYDSPPPNLRSLHTLVGDLMSATASCTDTAEVTFDASCVPQSVRRAALPEGP